MATSYIDLDEIVFKNRNKDYGAYDLRKRYARTTFLGIVFGAIFVSVVVAFPLVYNQLAGGAGDISEDIKETVAELKELPPIDKEKEPEEIKAEPPPPPMRSQVQFVEPEVVKHEEAPKEITIANQDTIKTDVGTKDVVGDPDAPPSLNLVEESGTGTKPVEVAAVVEREPDINEFIDVERQPAPANMEEIRKNMTYPPILKDQGTQGKVQVKILVDKEGNPKKHKVLRSPHKLFTESVEREIYKLKFTPAIQAGKPIMMWVVIPFDFKLK